MYLLNICAAVLITMSGIGTPLLYCFLSLNLHDSYEFYVANTIDCSFFIIFAVSILFILHISFLSYTFQSAASHFSYKITFLLDMSVSISSWFHFCLLLYLLAPYVWDPFHYIHKFVNLKFILISC